MVYLGQIRVDKPKLGANNDYLNSVLVNHFHFGLLSMWRGANNHHIWLARFKPTPILPNFTFGQLHMCIGANN